MKGNVLDLAIAVVIGGAFGGIVSSMVNDLIMPVLGILTGGHDFSFLTLTVSGVAIHYGLFLNAVVNFLIIAFCLFLVVKGMNAMKKKQDAAPAAPVAPSNEEKLLTEIRDLLKK